MNQKATSLAWRLQLLADEADKLGILTRDETLALDNVVRSLREAPGA
jgi:hypothetical protein